MATKTQMVGVVVSDKMDQSVVVAIERQVRHDLYGKTQRRTSKFLAHNEGNAAREGDLVEIYGCRPMSRRKRWVVSRIVRRALDLRAGSGGDAGTEAGSPRDRR